MSLKEEGFERAIKLNKDLNEKVNNIFKEMKLELSDKVQMSHYGDMYLFGNKIDEQTSDEEIKKIINSTDEKDYNGHIDFFGRWISE